MRKLAPTVALAAIALLLPLVTAADAIIRTQAMFAETIAEISLTDAELTVELEIGMQDIPAFRNLLPDEIYRDLGYGEERLKERLQKFFDQDLVFLTGDSTKLTGRLTSMAPEERIRRDPISGEPVPVKEDAIETVIRARLVYELNEQLDTLSFGAGITLRNASIGYVFYHQTIAVNDFRYLTPAQTVNLDWNDPWYSAFSKRALQRTYFAPMSGFIYVEPYEVRKEIILRPKDLQHWIELGLSDKDIIPAGDQAEIRRKVGEFLRVHHKVLIDGESIEPELARINFLERTLRTSRVIDPPVDLDINAAILGAIFVYPTVEPLPQKVTMEWDLFNDKIQRVPVSAVDQAGPLPSFLEPDYAVLEWQNFLKNPELPTLVDLRSPPTDAQRAANYLQWIMLVLTLLLAWQWWKGRGNAGANSTRAGLTVASALVITSISFWVGQGSSVSDEQAAELVGGLLHNIYRAFDFRQEEQIYDVLDQSVEGDLLVDIYLETRRGLELANQGGARAKVKNIEIIDLATRSGGDGGLLADVTWKVSGSVGHWGHIHQRQNQYEAELRIDPVEGTWKLTGLELISEQRL